MKTKIANHFSSIRGMGYHLTLKVLRYFSINQETKGFF